MGARIVKGNRKAEGDEAAWRRALALLRPGELAALETAARGQAARRQDSPAGFAHFYRLIYGRSLPRHALEEWVRPLYAARVAGKGLIVEAFRGSSKTTTLTVAFSAFRIGQAPGRSHLLVQAGDEMAADSAGQIADIIAHNPGWRQAFPHVAPDRRQAWGVGGYEVRRTDLPYAAWRALCGREKGKDPCFVGLGYRSRALIGKHPTGLLVVDDIHDENNTRSRRELDTVLQILQGTILPMVRPETWQVFVGTPWASNDALQQLKATGRFVSVKTPIVRKDEGGKGKDEGGRMRDENDVLSPKSEVRGKGFNPALRHSEAETERATRTQTNTAEESIEPGLPNNPVQQASSPNPGPGTLDLGPGTSDVYTPTWPEVFPLSEIEKQRQLVGEAEFARMFLLDLRAAEGVNLKADWLHSYPHEKLDPSWPVVMGVDYASTADTMQGGERDYYAVAIGRALPGGAGVVLVDGFRARVSQGEAEQQLKALAARYPTTQVIGVEAVGKGEEFYHLLLRSSLLPVLPMQPGGRSKGARFERGMAPLFQFGRAWLADVETPFLRAFREEWLRWPDGEHDDTLDAVYWMLYAARHHLMGGGVQGRRERGRHNPFGGFGRG